MSIKYTQYLTKILLKMAEYMAQGRPVY